MSLQFSMALVFSLFCLTAPAWADLQAAVDAAKRGDYETAEKEFRKLATEGDAIAQYHLGVMYAKGRGVPQDYTMARQWYEKSAAQGNVDAQTSLGTLYLNGRGIPQNYHTALFWFRLAGNKRDAIAQWKLGMMYEQGKGVPQDYVEAHKWYTLAAASGDKVAAGLRDVLAKQMTPAEIAEAQKLAREWKPNGK